MRNSEKIEEYERENLDEEPDDESTINERY